MADVVKRVAIRLEGEGGASVVEQGRVAEKGLIESSNRTTENAVRNADLRIAKLRAEANEAVAEARRANQAVIQAQGEQMDVVRNRIDRTTGVSRGDPRRAEYSAQTLFAADDRAAQLAARIRAEIDPLAAATDRYNAELAEMSALQTRGHLTAQEFARGQELAKNRLDATTMALGRNTAGLTRNQMASRLNLTRQAADVAVTASMGMNPAMIAMQQGPQIADALATSGLRASASMLALGGAVAVAAGSVVALGAAYLQAEGGYLALDRAATGLGRTAGLTAEQLQAMAREGAAAADISIGAAEKQAAAFVSTGRIGGEVLGDLIGLSRDYARFFGQDATEATASLAKAMLDPAAAAREWTREFGLLDQVTIKHIESLQKQGKLTEAQIILADSLSAAVSGQADKLSELESAWDRVARAAANAWDWIGKALHRTSDERIASLESFYGLAPGEDPAPDSPVYGAFLQSGLMRLRVQKEMERWAAESAVENQAAQLAADGAPKPKKDRSAEREARERLMRQRREEDHQAALARNVAELQGDRARVMALEDEAAVRQRIRQLVDDGQSQSAAEATAEAERVQLVAARADQMDRLLRDRGRELEVADAVAAGDHASARFVQDKIDWQKTYNDYLEITRSASLAQILADTELAALAGQRADAIQRSVDEREREHRLTLAELSGNTRLAEQMRRENDIQRRAREIEKDGDRNGRVLNRGEGVDQAAEELARETHAQMIGAGRDWAKGLAADIRQSGIRDALADQFESAVDRMINRMIDSLFDMDWSALMGGGKGGAGGIGGWITGALTALFGGPPGKNARGTDWWRGGLSWVGEEGPELLNLPTGAQVIDADRSRRLAAGGGSGAGGGPQAVSFSFAPVIHAEGAGPREIEALSAKLDAMAASLPSVVPQIVQDAMNRRVIR